MLTDPLCPVCGATAWTIVGERTYRRPASLEGRHKPFRVLFEVWARGEHEFRVQFAVCNACAMMIYVPRPSVSDIDAKYHALAQYGDSTPSLGESPQRTRRRSQRVYDIVMPKLLRGVHECRILDFGGGDGRLLTRFVEAGATCDLVDYCESVIPGVQHVGRTVDCLPSEPTYDAIICSHVVEHLAEPLPIVRELVRNLRPGGVIYVEVPVEMVEAMPAPTEPVTHCNFFIPESLAALMERAGCRITRCGLTAYPHPSGHWALCAGATATPGETGQVTRGGVRAITRYLRPSVLFTLRLRMVMWRSMAGRVRQRVVATLRRVQAMGTFRRGSP